MAYMVYAVSSIANNISILALLYEELSESLLLYDGINKDYIRIFKERGLPRLIGLTSDEMNIIKKYIHNIDGAFNNMYIHKDDKQYETFISKTTREFMVYIQKLLINLKSKLDVSYTDLIGDEEKCLKK